MGGAVSTGRNNDDLINNLLEADYIKTPSVERVFRCVDRGEYFLPDARCNAYKDLAWKSGNLHLSAPCIYSEVMEGLCLSQGLSFLNMGSGTGYLSTMVGLILGSGGINHGIEIHEDVVQYANKKLEIFKKYSGAIDEFDFCEPKFMQGNCLCLMNDTRRYDRIYCGAGCPENYENYVKALLKVGGILVMPLNEQLLQIKRISESAFENRSLLPVSFATLISPPEGKNELIQIFPIEPYSLQELCRNKIRNILRQNIEPEFPNLRKATAVAKKQAKRKFPLRRLVVPIFDNSEESSDDEEQQERRDNLLSMRHGFSMSRERGRLLSVSIIKEIFENAREHRENGDSIADEEAGDTAQNDVLSAIESEETIEEKSVEGCHTCEVEAMVEPQPEQAGLIMESDTKEDEDSMLHEWRNSFGNVNSGNNTKKTSRAKFDSGIGDEEIMEVRDDSSESSDSTNYNIDVDMHSSTEDERQDFAENYRYRRQNAKVRRIQYSNDSDSNQESERHRTEMENEVKTIFSPFTDHMRRKIKELPLPLILKKYINYYREL